MSVAQYHRPFRLDGQMLPVMDLSALRSSLPARRRPGRLRMTAPARAAAVESVASVERDFMRAGAAILLIATFKLSMLWALFAPL